jgi:hypothetical protein
VLARDEPWRPNPLLAIAAEQWVAAWRLSASLSWASAAALFELSDPRRLRRAWSADLTGIVDRTLRSPEFLRLMACNLRAMADVTRLTSTLSPR